MEIKRGSIALANIIIALCVNPSRAGATADSCSSAGILAPSGGILSAERRLLGCLLSPDKYNIYVRPSVNGNRTVNVVVDSLLNTVLQLDEKTGILTTQVFLFQSWVDPQLSWNPSDFDGIKDIRIPVSSIWTPNIMLYNSVDESFPTELEEQRHLAVVNSTGTVVWMPHGVLRSRCNLDMRRFPFDTQQCLMEFGSRSYDKLGVNIRLNPASWSNFREVVRNESEWNTVGYYGYVTELAVHVNAAGVSHYVQYPVAAFVLSLQRTSKFYQYTLIAPSVLVVILTLSLYWVPVQSGERFMLASGVYVSSMLMLVILEGHLPTDLGSLPVVATYISYLLTLALITIIISICVFNCHHRHLKRSAVPPIIRRIFLGPIGRLCCVTTTMYGPVSRAGFGEDDGRLDRSRDYGLEEFSHSEPTVEVEPTNDSNNGAELAEGHVGRRRRAKEAEPTHRDIVIGEWQRVALVIDRFSFALFSFISLGVTISLYGH